MNETSAMKSKNDSKQKYTSYITIIQQGHKKMPNIKKYNKALYTDKQ